MQNSDQVRYKPEESVQQAEQSRRPLQLKESTIKTLEKTLGINSAQICRKPIVLKNRRVQIQNEDSDDDEQVRMVLNPR